MCLPSPWPCDTMGMVSTPKQGQVIAADKVRVNMILPRDLVDDFDILAARNMTTRTDMVRRAMLAYQASLQGRN